MDMICLTPPNKQVTKTLQIPKSKRVQRVGTAAAATANLPVYMRVRVRVHVCMCACVRVRVCVFG